MPNILRHLSRLAFHTLASATLFTTLLSVSMLATVQAASTVDPAAELVRYTVKKGDTLWDISARFLEKPWLWPKLWKQNTHIKNPHLIYPNDVLHISATSIRLIRSSKMRTDKLRPEVRVTFRGDAITTIEPSAIIPFLNQSIVVEEGSLDNAGYVLQGTNDEIVLGKNSQIFATGLATSHDGKYQLFRSGRIISDPSTNKHYGMEGVHLGNAVVIQHNGKVSVLEITRANQEIRPGDRLIPIDKPVELPHYFPHKPSTVINGNVILVPKGVNEAARRDIIMISSGENDGLENGHVLEVLSHKGEIRDPVTGGLIALPALKIATAMVFKTYNNVSYAILMESSQPVKLGDRVSSPAL